MMCYFHRNAMKSTQKQAFMLFKSDLSKSSKDLLLQLHLEREKVLKLLQESNRNRIQRILEELHQSIINYVALFRGFAISPLHDLGGVSEKFFSQFHPSPLRRMYGFEWTDSIGEKQLMIIGDSFVELASILFNYALWLMKWCTSFNSSSKSSSMISLNPSANRRQQTPISSLLQAAGLFRFIRENLGRYLIQSEQDTIFGTDLDPDVIRAYELQCNGEAREFLFLSMMGSKQKQVKKEASKSSKITSTKNGSNQKKSSSSASWKTNGNKRQRSMMDMIRLARTTRDQFRQSSESIATSLERRLKKWHCYLLNEKILFEAWEYLLLLQERKQPQPIIDFDFTPMTMDDEKIFWHKIDECLRSINVLSIKYNKYGQEFAKNDPKSWTNRVIDAKKFIKNLQNHMDIVREDIRIRTLALVSNNPTMNKTISSTNLLDKFIRPIVFHLPKLHDYWTVNVCLEFGVEIFIPNYDPFAATNLKIANVNNLVPIWSRRFTALKKTNKDLENFDQSLDGQCPEFRNCCLKLRNLRNDLQKLFHEQIDVTKIENFIDFKSKLIDQFNSYLSWTAGLMANNQSRQLFGFCWTSSIDTNVRCIVYDIEFEICSTIYILAIWQMKSVCELLMSTENSKDSNKKEDVWKNSDYEFLIQTLRESAGMFQYILDRTKSNKYFGENDCDFLEPVLRSYRNHCLAEAQELLFRLSNISWIQLKITIRILQLYWAISEDLNDSTIMINTNRPECTEKIYWRHYCQMKSYLYKSLGYFYLSEMFPKSGERTVAALQKSLALLRYFRKQLVENQTIYPWIMDDNQFDRFSTTLDERFQQMCIHFVLNNHENFMKKYDINLDTVVINRQLDSMILLQPIKFYQPIADDFWLKDTTIQQALIDLTTSSSSSSSSTSTKNENVANVNSGGILIRSKPIAIIKQSPSTTMKSALPELKNIPSKTMIIISSPVNTTAIKTAVAIAHGGGGVGGGQIINNDNSSSSSSSSNYKNKTNM
nr:uncharacterized protein LOC124497037 [Dermatophagoides farinae]